MAKCCNRVAGCGDVVATFGFVLRDDSEDGASELGSFREKMVAGGEIGVGRAAVAADMGGSV